ncbi:DUF5682 family protein [Lapillicoccus jejuensis]|uniref:Uncharacterized protein n=1 Tax=Lapillicoccus jejuensis TaxID=402171 RepID=A0A542E3L5_9MICO|nr:DUF5682 family protein [Lapillicoccus jejuensis]TQJ09915.1 hypothetical protein FB458_3031 [Lapillicoccus jejuensis]
MTDEGTWVLGVRHHGPGSARAVLAELERVQPDAVLVEGPADADPLLPWVTHAGMQPPVALLAHVVGDADRSSFWPFAVFSPEWQALTWAVSRGVTVRFMDLPSTAVLAHRRRVEEDLAAEGDGEEGSSAPGAEDVMSGASVRGAALDVVLERTDPIALLARAAGYDDAERWWDDVVEHRGKGGGFEAITEAMAVLREDDDGGAHGGDGAGGAARRRTGAARQHEERREAHMRQVLRAVRKAGARRVVVVCGAWHAPALTGVLPPATRDAAVLRGMPKVRTALTWVPWTHSRLAFASGYGAGVESPGWYHHLFTCPDDRVVTRWLARVSARLRERDLPISSAHVIEAVRLAETVATMRGRPLAGLGEVTDATRAVLCQGDETLVELVTREVVVGERLGVVPDEAPSTPLDADLRATARRLRLALEPAPRDLVLDLRKDTDRARSHLLHRLLLLEVPWGAPQPVDGTGTFKEAWTLEWDPVLSVALAVASPWGTTVEVAATARASDLALDPGTPLAGIAGVLDRCLLADLPAAVPGVLDALRDRAALDSDVEHLMEALPALARAVRYGDVRGTDASALAEVTESLLARVRAGLPAAVTGLGDDAAAALRQRLDEVDRATTLMPATSRERWLASLTELARREDLHGLLAGRLVRLLHDARLLDDDTVARRLSQALSVGTTPADKAAWVDGLLAGTGTVLVHDDGLVTVLDGWLRRLVEDEFTTVLPLLRRTFGTFAATDKRALGTLLARLVRAGAGGPGAASGASSGGRLGGGGAGADVEWGPADRARAEPVVAAVARLLGVERG